MRCTSEKCIGFGKPEGHLDDQLYQECKDTKYDRDVQKKHRKRKKKEKKSFNLKKYLVAKKEKWDPNPWAVCHSKIDKEKEPEKFERCVQHVKNNQKGNKK
jgi:hypothetical protein